jgi:hypothetical protein
MGEKRVKWMKWGVKIGFNGSNRRLKEGVMGEMGVLSVCL